MYKKIAFIIGGIMALYCVGLYINNVQNKCELNEQFKMSCINNDGVIINDRCYNKFNIYYWSDKLNKLYSAEELKDNLGYTTTLLFINLGKFNKSDLHSDLKVYVLSEPIEKLLLFKVQEEQNLNNKMNSMMYELYKDPCIKIKDEFINLKYYLYDLFKPVMKFVLIPVLNIMGFVWTVILTIISVSLIIFFIGMTIKYSINSARRRIYVIVD